MSSHDLLPTQSSLLYLIATASRAFMTKVNHTSVDGVEHLKQALQRPQGQALITVSNHVAAMDDPLVISSLVPSDYFSDPGKLRWALWDMPALLSCCAHVAPADMHTLPG